MNRPDAEPIRPFQPIDASILARYFNDTATPSDRAAVAAWVGDDASRQAAVAAWHAAWMADAEHFAAVYDAEGGWDRLSTRLGLLTLVRDGGPPRPVRSPVDRALGAATPDHALAVAAAVAGLAVGIGTWRVAVKSGRLPIAVAAAAREYVIPRGQRGIVRLPDGSEVMLNADSKLTVPTNFGAAGQQRVLDLQGQAYFTVVHDDTRPFVVRTAFGSTRDVGTRFDVRAYSGELAERVAVAEGEVTVRGGTSAVEVPLRRGQVATIDSIGRVAVVAGANLAHVTTWTQGRLRLDNVTLAEAARELGRWYDLDVHIADDELAQRRVVGSYQDEPVAQVLGVVAAAVGARYERQGRSVVFVEHNRR